MSSRLWGTVVVVDPLLFPFGGLPVAVDDLDGAPAVRVVFAAWRVRLERGFLAQIDGAAGDEHRAERARVTVGHATPTDGAGILFRPFLDCAPSAGEHRLVEHAQEQAAGGRPRSLFGLSLGQMPHDVRGAHPVEFLGRLLFIEPWYGDGHLAAGLADARLTVLRQVAGGHAGAELVPAGEQVDHGFLPDRLRAGEVVEVERGVP